MGGRPRGGWPDTVVRGVWCQAPSLPQPPVLWSRQPGFRDPCVPGAVGAGVETQHRPHSVRPCGLALLAVGVAEGRPRGGVPSTIVRGFWCQALSLPRARPLERVGGVPRPVCPGCGRCGGGDPAPSPQRAPLRAGVARCGGGGRASPGGVPSTILRGASEVRRCPSVDCLPTGRAVGVLHPRAVGAGVWVWGPNTVPLAYMPCGGCVPLGWVGGRPRGGCMPSTIVRGVWCQALSLPWPPVLWSGQPGFRDPCVPGAVGAGVGTQHRPHSVRPCGPALLAVGVAGGHPRGGCLPPLLGASGVRRCPSPGRPSSGAGSQGSATRVSRVRSVRAWGPSTGPTACALAGRRCSLWGWRKGVPGGGAFHHCEGRLRSGAVPPPTARPLGGLLASATHLLWARLCGCGGPTLSP